GACCRWAGSRRRCSLRSARGSGGSCCRRATARTSKRSSRGCSRGSTCAMWGRSMKPSNTRSRRAANRFIALPFAAATASGCVTRGKYDRAVGELEKERVRVADLERSNEALGGERLKLIDEMEDLRQNKEQLTEEVAKLEKTRAELTSSLQEHEA